MQQALEQFRDNMRHVRELGHLYRTLAAQTFPFTGISDLLRAELVLAVSALDHFVHELVRIGMLESFDGNRPRTQAFLRFVVSMEAALQGIQDAANNEWFDEEVRHRHGHQSFQQAGKIADAIRLVSDVRLWNDVGTRLRRQAKDIKDELDIIVRRRNEIAHEADMDPTNPGSRRGISETEVVDALSLIETIAEAIFVVV